MARTKQTARRAVGGKAPRKSHASQKSHASKKTQKEKSQSDEKSKSIEEKEPLPKKSEVSKEESIKKTKKDLGELFRTKPSFHPKTNEPIVIGGKAYNKLEEKYGEPNKIKSPKTQSKIGVNKGEYKKLIKEGYTDNQLLYDIIDNQPKTNKSKEENIKSFKDIVLLNDYLIQLDYVDLRNLCRTDKSFESICDDEIIKGILAETIPNVVFKMNVAKLLKNLDNQIEKLINIHYPDMPVWVNKELFMISFKKKIYNNLAEKLNDLLSDHVNKGKFVKEMYNADESMTVMVNKSFLAFALISNDFDEPDDDDINLYTNDITLSKEFVKYLLAAVLPYKSYRDAMPIIEKLLFIRK